MSVSNNSHGKKIAIVGGSGFVGSSLCGHLSKLFDVTVFDVNPPGNFSGKFTRCDIRDGRRLIEKLQGFDLAINTAIIQLPQINNEKRLGYEVNVLGIQNMCEAVESVNSLKGLLHVSSWHVFGETGLKGILKEDYGFHPDKIEDRARLYAMTKIAQESIIRVIDQNPTKFYGIIRVGTVLGEGMPNQTAASLFIENALNGRFLTPFRHTQHRPMLYVDIKDVCHAFESFVSTILKVPFDRGKLGTRTINLMGPKPLSIIQLARVVQKTVSKATSGRIKPKIKVIDQGIKPIYSSQDVEAFRADLSLARSLLKVTQPIRPQQTIERIVRARLAK